MSLPDDFSKLREKVDKADQSMGQLRRRMRRS